MKGPPRYHAKRKNLARALSKLREVLTWSRDELSNVYVESAIQRFEYTNELVWKVMREVLLHQDGELTVLGSRDAVRQGFARGLLRDRKVWMDMLTDRNQTSHIYNEDLAREIFDNIVDRYIESISKFNEHVQSLP